MEVEPDINVDDNQGRSMKPPPMRAQTSHVPSPNIVFDNDPEIFSPDEKLKVGIISDEDGQPRRYLCQYCRTSCDAARSLKVNISFSVYSFYL